METTPTLFLHGYSGSLNSEKFLVQSARNAGATKNIIKALVDRDGQVTLKGTYHKKASNPIVMVEFERNKHTDFRDLSKWLKQVLVSLQNEYDIKDFNMVAHSMGNITLSYYLLNYGDDPSLPKLKKQVSIAGPFNGVMAFDGDPRAAEFDADGKPKLSTPVYEDLLYLRTRYPNKQVDVLNVFGDVEDGSKSDERVTNASSMSLKYLVQDRAKSYQSYKVTGPDGQHSQLHESDDVANKMIQFLWEKATNK